MNGQTTSFYYSASAPQLQAISPQGTRKVTTDGLGRPIKVESVSGAVVETEYKPCGCSPSGKMWRTSQPHAVGAAAVWTQYAYDSIGRTTQVTMPAGHGSGSTTYSGNEVTSTDPAGKWKKLTSDSMGRLTKVEEPGGLFTYYTYNFRDQLTQVQMPRGGTTQYRTFNYDPNGLLSSAANPENGTVTYAYNGDGSVAHKIDAKGQKVAYTYDGLKRVTRIDRTASGAGSPDVCQQTVFTYDTATITDVPWNSTYNLGRLTEAANGAGSCAVGKVAERYSYDQKGLVLMKRLAVDRSGATGSLDEKYKWTVEGSLDVQAYPAGGPVFRIPRDAVQRPLGLQRIASFDDMTVVETLASGATFDAASQLTGVSYNIGGAYSESRTYDEIGQLVHINLPGVFSEQYVLPAAANNGRISQSVTGSETVTYTYDSLNRLTFASGVGGNPSSWSQGYGYDGFGNLTSMGGASWTVDAATNRLTGGGITYDANGNQLKTPAGQTVSYDIENRIVANPVTGNSYAYAADNRRVADGTGDGKVYVFWGLNGVSGRYQGTLSGGVWTFAAIDVRLAIEWALLAEGTSSGGAWSWIRVVTDRIGSVRVRGAQSLSYYPFGEERGSPSPHAKVKFGTYWREDGTGLDYADQRHYSSSTGRFGTVDQGPTSDSHPSSWNRYCYTWGDPTNNFNDVDGRLPGNVSFDGGWTCRWTPGLVGPSGPQSHLCPDGMSVQLPRAGGQSTLQLVANAFDLLAPYIEDWDYANERGTAFDIGLATFDDYVAIQTSLASLAVPVIYIGGRLIITVAGVATLEVIRAALEKRGQYKPTTTPYDPGLCEQLYSADKAACFAGPTTKIADCLRRAATNYGDWKRNLPPI